MRIVVTSCQSCACIGNAGSFHFRREAAKARKQASRTGNWPPISRHWLASLVAGSTSDLWLLRIEIVRMAPFPRLCALERLWRTSDGHSGQGAWDTKKCGDCSPRGVNVGIRAAFSCGDRANAP